MRARHGQEHSPGLWKIEMNNARAQAATEQEAAVARCHFVAAAALDNAHAHAENRCERLEEGFVRERDRAAVADLVLADCGAQLREDQAMVSEFQNTALGVQARVDEFVEQYAESTKRVIDRECSDVKKHEQDLVENAEALAWHEESVVTELRQELQQASLQVSRGSGLARRRAVVKPIDLGRPPTGPVFQSWLAEFSVNCCAASNRSRRRTMRFLKAVEKAPTHTRPWRFVHASGSGSTPSLRRRAFDSRQARCFAGSRCTEMLFSGGVWMCLVVLLCGLSCRSMSSRLEHFSRSDCQDSLDSLSLATLVSSWTAWTKS